MQSPFSNDHELATATLGSIGVHYDLPEELEYMGTLSPEEAESYAQEMTAILASGALNLASNLQNLKAKSQGSEIREAWAHLLGALGMSLMAASVFTNPAMQEELEGVSLHEMVLTPEQIEAMLGEELEAMLSEHCEGQVTEDLKASRADYAARS